jgi:hypothetical protein
MAEIKFSGNKLLKTINKEWCEKFPYLYIGFYNPSGNPVNDMNITHASIRKNKNASEISTNGNMLVETFEKRYKEAYGVEVEVKYIKGDRHYRTLGEHNKLTLSEMNKWAKENGAQEIKKAKPEWF